MADSNAFDESGSTGSDLKDAIDTLKTSGSDYWAGVEKFKNDYDTAAEKNIKPEDEYTYPDSLPRNYLISKIGLPDSWKQSAADDIRFQHNLPAAMGMGTAGTVANIEGTAAQKLAMAADSGFGRLVAGHEIAPNSGSAGAPLGKVIRVGDQAPSLGAPSADLAKYIAMKAARENR